MRVLLTELQFGPRAVRVVPVSSLEGVNLTSPGKFSGNTRSASDGAIPELAEWYTGPTLLELMNSFKEPPRQVQRASRHFIAPT
jgi:translation elongation factor EF-1alpha